MLIDTSLIPGWMNLVAALLLLSGLASALRWAEWRAVSTVPGRIHLLSLATLFCLALWSLSAPVGDALRLHLLGMTSVTLLVGWRFALLCGSLALLTLLLVSGQPLSMLPIAGLLTILIPASVSRLVLHFLPKQRNLFLFTLGGGFAGGILSALSVAVAATLLLALAGHDALVQRAAENWPVIVLVLFPEGFINGTLVTAGCVFFPDAVKTFDDQFYLAADDDAETED